jgi:hypothetical protein
VFLLSYKGSQYTVPDSLQHFTTHITNDAKQKIINPPWTLIVMLGQGA